MSPINTSDTPIAVCYLGNEGDSSNQCLLSESTLTITRKRKTTSYALDEIEYLSINSRKMMLPLITGGIFVPLSIIAIAKNIFAPWGILSWLMLNLLLFYFGWLGYSVLTVQLKSLSHDFPIKVKGANLKAFIHFTNEYIRFPSHKEPHVSPLYHILTAESWASAQKTQIYTPDSLKQEGFIHLSNKEQVPLVLQRYFENTTSLMILHIDPLKLASPLKYEAVYDLEGLYPHLYGALNLDAIIKVENITYEKYS